MGKHKGLSLDPQRHQHQKHQQLEEEELAGNRREIFQGQEHLYASLETQEYPQPQKKRSHLPSSSTSFGSKSTQHARKMGDSHHQAATSSRLGIRHHGGEIVEVQGGHIVRSTGRKDRHSKVCTAKGPRDRRVRLSAHTAIQFYDVQDRLGYDRPSKAVDWLIKKAKPAIDELAELPPWNPESLNTTASIAKPSNQEDQITTTTTDNDKPYQFHINHGGSLVENLAAGSGTRRRTATIMGNEVQSIQQQEMGDNPSNNSGFLPPSLVSDEIADTIKSFFPVGASSETPSSSIQFQNYPPDLLSRTSSHSQDLRLSLQSFPEPILLHQHHHHAQAAAAAQAQHSEPVLFSGTSPLAGFDGSSAGWEHHHHHPGEIGRFQRLFAWNNSGAAADTGSGGGASGGGSGGTSQFPQPTNTIKSKKTSIIKLFYLALDSPHLVYSLDFAFQHEFRAKKMSTTASPISCPLLHLILTIDQVNQRKAKVFPLYLVIDLSALVDRQSLTVHCELNEEVVRQIQESKTG
ncbi:hypothetical protein V6N11_038528 [Hibiscus sabdariffa]|uniref:TCP domain-containing protein n=1 Tax=Hibiscus sabdariffa TaxID=183260 RepID=A0ABR2SKX9_9ROSI